jgi:hypothetical protein
MWAQPKEPAEGPLAEEPPGEKGLPGAIILQGIIFLKDLKGFPEMISFQGRVWDLLGLDKDIFQTQKILLTVTRYPRTTLAVQKDFCLRIFLRD